MLSQKALVTYSILKEDAFTNNNKISDEIDCKYYKISKI